MPTGYTAEIAKGITFEEFVCQCARAFGALIHLRDEPLSSDIPDEVIPSDYHAKALVGAEIKYKEALEIKEEQAKHLAKEEFDAEMLSYQDRLYEKHELKRKYEDMLAKVRAWNPPTTEHEGLKKFMIEQLTSSIDFDCSTDYIEVPKLKSPKEWCEKNISNKLWNYNYHKEENEKEIQRCKERTEWVKALKESLKGEIKC